MGNDREINRYPKAFIVVTYGVHYTPGVYGHKPESFKYRERTRSCQGGR